MRIDLYTKTILTVIALLLAVNALKPILQPQPAMAQGNLNGVQFATDQGKRVFFDSRTGDIWIYGGDQFMEHLKVAKLGSPLTH